MADIRPFRGLRFDPARVDVSACTCPPYDVISPAEQAGYHARGPHNIIRIELGAGPADPAIPGNRYASAGETLARWMADGTLVREAAPAIYLYEHEFTVCGGSGGGVSTSAARRRRALLVAGRLHDWSEGAVLPHEDTRAGPKQDRLALLRATQTNVSPLWLLYDDPGREVAAALASEWAAPAVAVSNQGDERHILRAVTGPAALRATTRAFATRPLYIADGHHRYETALTYRNERRAAAAAASPATSDAGYEFVLMMLVALDDPGLVVLPTHRLVRHTGRPAAEIRGALGRWFTVAALALQGNTDAEVGAHLRNELVLAAIAPGEHGEPVFALLDGEGAWLLRPRSDTPWLGQLPAGHSDAWRGLDVAVLDALAIRDVCGIRAEGESADPNATSHAPSDRLAYVSSAGGAVAAVRTGEAEQAFLLNPTRVEQVCAVAAAGDRMPPKSTFFFPKPVTGLVMHPLDDVLPRP